MEKALEKLDALVSEAMDLEKDPSAPERLAADIEIAEAAKQALQILRAVQVLAQPANTRTQCCLFSSCAVKDIEGVFRMGSR
jgi:hypothetical protein